MIPFFHFLFLWWFIKEVWETILRFGSKSIFMKERNGQKNDEKIKSELDNPSRDNPTNFLPVPIVSKSMITASFLLLMSLEIKMDCSSRFTFYYHNCILTSSSQLKCWGDGGNGKLGYGNINTRGNAENQMSDYLPFVNVNSNVQSIHSGDQHTCVHLSPSFDVKCWGDNSNGRLGYGDTQDRGDEANEMGSFLPTISSGSGVLVSEVSAGSFHNFILTDSGQIKGWGYCASGQLGYGDSNNRGDSANQMGNYLPFVQLGSGKAAISSKNQLHSSCVILDDLSVKCWGKE